MQALPLVSAMSLLVCSSLGGCLDVSWSSSSSNGVSGRNVALATLQPETDDLPSRTLTRTFSKDATPRLLNFGGPVEIETAAVDAIEVTVVIAVDAGTDEATDAMLDGLAWSTRTDGSGRPLTGIMIPPDGLEAFHSPLLRSGEIELRHGDLRAIARSERTAETPTILSSMHVVCPPGSSLFLRSVLGDVRGGVLDGELTIVTSYGDVAVERSRGRLSVNAGSGEVHVRDAGGELDVDAGSGSVRVGQASGRVGIDLGSGDVVIDEASDADIDVAAGSGDVSIHRGSLGSLVVGMGSGDAVLSDVDFESFEAKAGSGSIHLTSDLERADRIVVGTGSGSVTISAGPDASFQLSADTGSGRVRVGFDDARLLRDGNKVVGATRGDGRTLISIDTGSGDVIVKPRD